MLGRPFAEVIPPLRSCWQESLFCYGSSREGSNRAGQRPNGSDGKHPGEGSPAYRRVEIELSAPSFRATRTSGKSVALSSSSKVVLYDFQDFISGQ